MALGKRGQIPIIGLILLLNSHDGLLRWLIIVTLNRIDELSLTGTASEGACALSFICLPNRGSPLLGFDG